MTQGPHTSFCVLTPPAPGAIAVIGINGPDTAPILSTILRRRAADAPPELKTGRPTVCRIADAGLVVDDAVVVLQRAGQDGYAEICTHGGLRVVQRVVSLLERHGARKTDSTLFPHAHTADNYVQKEIDEHLIKSMSLRLTRWLLSQREVMPSHLKRASKVDLAERAAFVERSRVAMRLLAGMRIALVGPPNAGKSTLANRLIGKDRVITSDQPGTTRDWVSETALIDGWPVTLTDTAGIRDTTCAIESEAIRLGTEQAATADLVVIVLDSTLEPWEHTRSLARINESIPPGMRRLVVMNKGDVARTDWKTADISSTVISAKYGTGIEELERQIADALELHVLSDAEPAAVCEGQIAAYERIHGCKTI